ncbi:putative guanine deaminase [Neolecta irregularis DAH-3]|uniref:Probable guanine deaminase n=1 Tax=Neolecta irregularis (strain DAH-3) TaxID=1198029 RepID=A0A1U7LT69_NEOID|nr:putative guanine deaminase [Neolecta irregularis DAH-3]|eukprot:OLL25711.1 putative guanine deaminase [Neolecta irregularis DAH-3]
MVTSPLPPKQLFFGRIAYTLSSRELFIHKRAAIGVDGFGIIAFLDDTVSSAEEAAEKYQFQDADVTLLSTSQFLFPGLIDTHIHASQYPNCGIGMDLPLLDWLYKYTFPLESSFSNLEFARDVYTTVVKTTLKHGTTTAAYFATLHLEATNLLSEICWKLGQRAFIGKVHWLSNAKADDQKVCMTTLAPNYYLEKSEEESLSSTRQSIEYIRKIDPQFSRISPIITPRFAPSCTASLLLELGNLAEKECLPIQTHLAENKRETELVKSLYPESSSYTDVYDKANILTKRTILAHAIHLDIEERDLIAKRGSGVSHCPASNCAISSGIARVKWLLEGGVKVGLGTDCSGGYSPSVLDAARQASQVSRLLPDPSKSRLSLAELLFLATLGGAQVCGIADRAGSFEPGKCWDAILVDIGEMDYWDDSSILQKWVFGGDDRHIKKVWVDGKLVHENL